MEETSENSFSKTVSGDVVRYWAPELIDNSNVAASTSSDTYSFAMLVLECVTEKVPFSGLIRDAAVVHARITKKQSPPRPDGPDPKNRVSDDLWDLMMHCWAVKYDCRPTMEQVHSFFLRTGDRPPITPQDHREFVVGAETVHPAQAHQAHAGHFFDLLSNSPCPRMAGRDQFLL